MQGGFLRRDTDGALIVVVDDGGGGGGGGAVTVSDGGGSLTVDGEVAIDGPVTVADGGGSLTVDGAVTVSDGGGSLTVDGTVAVSSVGGAVSLAAGSQVIGKVGHDTTGGGCGRKTVASAGTREALAGSTAAKWVVITALHSNTNIVVVGYGNVVAAAATRAGTPLEAGDSVVFPCDNLADIKVDAVVSGEGVSYTYGT